jgi:hypothetical protein
VAISGPHDECRLGLEKWHVSDVCFESLSRSTGKGVTCESRTVGVSRRGLDAAAEVFIGSAGKPLSGSCACRSWFRCKGMGGDASGD